MAEYKLSRTKSSAIVRSNSVASRPNYLLSRTHSDPDLLSLSYPSTTSPYRYQFPNYYSYTSRFYPYRYYRDHSLFDSYWYDKYSYFSSLYSRPLFPRRYSYSDNVANPMYWNPTDETYWVRYKSYLYDYTKPYGRYTYPFYCKGSYYSPYRYWMWNSHAY